MTDRESSRAGSRLSKQDRRVALARSRAERVTGLIDSAATTASAEQQPTLALAVRLGHGFQAWKVARSSS